MKGLSSYVLKVSYFKTFCSKERVDGTPENVATQNIKLKIGFNRSMVVLKNWLVRTLGFSSDKKTCKGHTRNMRDESRRLWTKKPPD